MGPRRSAHSANEESLRTFLGEMESFSPLSIPCVLALPHLGNDKCAAEFFVICWKEVCSTMPALQARKTPSIRTRLSERGFQSFQVVPRVLSFLVLIRLKQRGSLFAAEAGGIGISRLRANVSPCQRMRGPGCAGFPSGRRIRRASRARSQRLQVAPCVAYLLFHGGILDDALQFARAP